MKQSKNQRQRSGFTLLELLVVITVISVLAGIAFPAYQTVVAMARRAEVTQKAKQIHLGMKSYAMDHGGVFPGGRGVHSSNDAFREIIEYVDYDERVFAVAGSNWGPEADNKIDSPEQILEAGENHFSYVAGLSETARGIWPLIVEGTDGGGQYTTEFGEKGGLRKGKYAVVCRVDGSAGAVRLEGTGVRRHLPKHDDPLADGLQVGSYMGKGARVLDPDSLD